MYGLFLSVCTVTCAVLQKTGAGLHTANSCYWDTALDGENFNWERHTLTCSVQKTTRWDLVCFLCRKLHREMGESQHVLCGQCVCCCHRIGNTKFSKWTYKQQPPPHPMSAVFPCAQQGAAPPHSLQMRIMVFNACCMCQLEMTRVYWPEEKWTT